MVAFLRPLREPDLRDPGLLNVTRIVMDHQERELRAILEPLDYYLEGEFIRSMMHLNLYGVGPSGIVGRIEGVSGWFKLY